MDDEQRLRDKLRAVEALHAGAATPGERDAAGRARERIQIRLAELQVDQPIEWQFSSDQWSHRLLLALARRYGLRPYRYPRQRHTTVVLRAPERFLREVFIPEYEQMVDLLNAHLSSVAARVIADVLDPDRSDVVVVDTPLQLEAFVTVKK